jgi:hypothetical protein
MLDGFPLLHKGAFGSLCGFRRKSSDGERSRARNSASSRAGEKASGQHGYGWTVEWRWFGDGGDGMELMISRSECLYKHIE